jgi:uncharacterized protein (DUF1015 family)
MKIQPFDALYPNLGVLTTPDTFFATVKYEFADYLKNEFFLQCDQPALFLCDIETPLRTHTGLLASVDIEEYLQGNIVKHEETLATTETHLTDLLMQRKAMIKPVLLTYQPHESLTSLMAEARTMKPLYSVYFEQEQHRHSYYAITNPDLIARFQQSFETHLAKAYIADGHHRCSSNASLYRSLEKGGAVAEPYRYLLSAFFAFDQVVINEYNRVVELPRKMSRTIFMAALSRVCSIKYVPLPSKPTGAHEMMLYINREWYRISWKKKVLKKYSDEIVIMDTDILNTEVLRNILGIEDIRNDSRISYVDGVSGVAGLADKTGKKTPKAGFYLYPIAMEDLVAIADAGKTLPPKRTWFEPRVKNGLISQRI